MEIKQRTRVPRRSGISGLVVTLITVAIGAGMTFAALGGIQDNLGGLTGDNRVAITNINAYTDTDRMVITGNIKNLGSTSMSSILIDEISAGNLLITQNPATSDGIISAGHGSLTMSGIGGDTAGTALTASTVDVDTDVTTTGTVGSGKINHGTGFTTDDGTKYVFNPVATGSNAVIEISGLTTDEDNLEGLTAGQSKSFRIVITGLSAGSSSATTLDVLATVPSGAELFMTVIGTDGLTNTISDARSSNVKQR